MRKKTTFSILLVIVLGIAFLAACGPPPTQSGGPTPTSAVATFPPTWTPEPEMSPTLPDTQTPRPTLEPSVTLTEQPSEERAATLSAQQTQSADDLATKRVRASQTALVAGDISGTEQADFQTQEAARLETEAAATAMDTLTPTTTLSPTTTLTPTVTVTTTGTITPFAPSATPTDEDEDN